jgi:hypothetical protein
MKLLSDRIQEFIDWLEQYTDFDMWHQSVKDATQRKLIEVLTEKDN